MEWYQIKQSEELSSPALVVYPERIEHNIQEMLQIAGSADRLWPHVKTHKMSAIVALQKKQGVTKFKCATTSEMLMLAREGVNKILLAHQPSVEKAKTLLSAQQKFSSTEFSTLCDNSDSLALFEQLSHEHRLQLTLCIDINNGMNRSGIVPEEAFKLYSKIKSSPHLTFAGLHVYDGHIRDHDLNQRIANCQDHFKTVEALIARIENEEQQAVKLITGGSPSFMPHALRQDNYLSPGTTLLWDLGYQKIWAESPFKQAALILTRLISKPAPSIYCFDLGHKALASEMPMPRVSIFGFEDAQHIGQSEEHLILKTTSPIDCKVGDLFYAVPVHICPTVAKYNAAYVCREHEVKEVWPIEARDYLIHPPL